MMKCDSRRLSAAATPALTLLLLFAFVFHLPQAHQITESNLVSKPQRRLLEGGSITDCNMEDLVVEQGATGPQPNGIPTYTVSVLNICPIPDGCAMGNIRLSCGKFSSARLINPRIFRRLRINDCLLNDGRPLPPGGVVSFKYANSFSYPLAISKATCVR